MYVFHCGRRTQDECLTRRIFGLTRAAFDGPIEALAPNVFSSTVMRGNFGAIYCSEKVGGFGQKYFEGKYPYQVILGDGKNYKIVVLAMFLKGTPKGLLN